MYSFCAPFCSTDYWRLNQHSLTEHRKHMHNLRGMRDYFGLRSTVSPLFRTKSCEEFAVTCFQQRRSAEIKLQ